MIPTLALAQTGRAQAIATAPPAGDPSFASVKLLMHFNGTDTSTSFVDQIGHTVTANGNAQLDTADKKWGTASGLFDGTGDYLTIPASTDFQLQSSDFCIELWCKPQSISGQDTFMTTRDSGGALSTANWLFYMSGGAPGFLAWDTAGGSVVGSVAASAPLSTSAWSHVAVTRSGSAFRLFVNGVQDGSATYAGNINFSSTTLFIGRDPTNSARDYHGWLDDIRMTVGAARYTSNFTPPAAEFPDF